MNTPSSWSDAQIHAYVDGELVPDAAARLAADSRSDAMLAARVAQQRELRDMLRGAFDPVLDEPVPKRLRDALSGGAPGSVVTPIGSAGTGHRMRVEPRMRQRWSLREWGAMAATLLLGLLLGISAFRKPEALPLEMAQGRLVARGELDATLSNQLSGAAPAGAVTQVALSFRAANGAVCRSFSRRDGPAGIACRSGGHWAVQLLDGIHGADNGHGTDYRQAASALSPAMLGVINALGGGEALTPEQEEQQRRSGWE
jgi:hypothetical protein